MSRARRCLLATSVICAFSVALGAGQRDADGERWTMRSPSAYPEVPKAIRQALEQQRCKIPEWMPVQRSVRARHNIVTGEFATPGRRDWAALCVRGAKATIIVFWEGRAGRMEEVVTNDFTLGKFLAVAAPEDVRAHLNPTLGDYDKPPSVIDHDGLHDGVLCCSTILYYYQGRWLRFPGAD